MRSFIDLHPDVRPQVTILVWVQIADEGDTKMQYIISTASYQSPGMSVSGTNIAQPASGNGRGPDDVQSESI